MQVSGLDRLARRVPGDVTPESFATYVTEVSEDLLDTPAPLSAPEAVAWAGQKARALGLDPDRLADDLGRGLAQTGSLGPDEDAEYRRNLATLLPGADAAPNGRPPDPAELYEALCELGRETVGFLRKALLGNDRTVVFLGTDAEFLKLSYDVWRGTPDASRAFYLSRLTLLSAAEKRILARTRQELFGADGVSDSAVDGADGGRHFAWMDNGLVASQLYLLITAARERAAAGEAVFGELFPRMFREELIHGRGQARRRAEGPLTLFGTPHPQADAVIRQGIDDGLFVQRCSEVARRFRVEAGFGTTDPVIVDIGANGTQPCLLLGLLTSGLTPPPSVVLFTSGRRVWGPVSPAFRSIAVTGRFAMAVETVKTYMTNYRGALRGDARELAVAPADQQLLAFFKQLAFHRAAIEQR
ncbi:hypothetical protein [Streptomyces ipomoeae]|uniref:hypothetical protein n=1 Tax=Streptomyces ipomoeae TaxID=103232 RepID=UPI00114766C7|nr:hypothetical protein [Streptomyces ipomoeae]MDX2938364.1 hypothetical protein [Streptomyces ipomoeae]TQE22068.1 hypothetical protein SipoB123_24550 [Streptomyces ipomoeae]